MPQIKSICIVGGGSAGWMSASLLSKFLKDIKITLIESPDVKTIGVGESTLGHFNKFLDALDLQDKDWMKSCDATYKSSIRFENFYKHGSTFHYPFGFFNLENNQNGIMDWFWLKAYTNNLDTTSFVEWFAPQAVMSENNKMTFNLDQEIPGWNFKLHTAYHMDATKFGIFLKDKIAIPNKVNHILDNIVKVNQDNKEFITSITTSNNKEIYADLFIDCTGFSKLLIEKTLKVPFISFNDVLLNDKAIATKIPYKDKNTEMNPYTNCIAYNNGWIWNIPLYSRIGTGYVYSSKFISDYEALDEFKNYLQSKNVDTNKLDFNFINIKHGIQKEPWKKNVCSIGLACGFIEPLESTGLLTTHENALRLLATLQRRNGYVNQLDIDGWNFAAREEMEGFKQFVSIHYGMSTREDTEYWKFVTNNIHYVKNHLDMVPEFRYNNLEMIYNLNQTLWLPSESPDGKLFIIAGMNCNPVSYVHSYIEESRSPALKEIWFKILKNKQENFNIIRNKINQMDTHYDFLKKYIYNE